MHLGNIPRRHEKYPRYDNRLPPSLPPHALPFMGSRGRARHKSRKGQTSTRSRSFASAEIKSKTRASIFGCCVAIARTDRSSEGQPSLSRGQCYRSRSYQAAIIRARSSSTRGPRQWPKTLLKTTAGAAAGGGRGGRGRTHARTHLARANLVDSINEAHAPRVLRPSIIIPCFFIDVASAKGRATRSFYSENTNLAPGRCERERNGAPALQ